MPVTTTRPSTRSAPLKRRTGTIGGVAALVLAVTGCGGGLYIGVGDDDLYDDPPNVSLVASVTAAAPGTVITFTAAASDDVGIRQVTLLRRSATGAVTAIASDDTPVYLWDTAVPDTTDASVTYFARAEDGLGQTNDSNGVVVQVLR